MGYNKKTETTEIELEKESEELLAELKKESEELLNKESERDLERMDAITHKVLQECEGDPNEVFIEKLLKAHKKFQIEFITDDQGESMNGKNMGTPVRNQSTQTEIVRQVEHNIVFDDEDSITFGEESQSSIPSCVSDNVYSRTPEELKDLKDYAEKQDGSAIISGKTNFADQIKIDFIPSIDYRIMCRFLGATTVGEIKNHPYQSNPLITLILMESLEKFMKSKGFNFVGELNFDQHGNSIPPDKNPWHVKGKETTFTTTGFLYFEHESGNKQNNVVYFLYADLERGGSQITCYSNDTKKSKDFINDLEEYSKTNNCLRGAKLKDVNMISASFSEVAINDKYTWDNYYYPESIKELFDLEVLGFMENVEQYNRCGINKRGLVIFGKPGGGKTTLGHIICNLVPEHTVIWITPEILTENNYKSMSSIKALYKLADFLSPCIILLEDLDLFSQDRDRGGDVMALGALMNVLDGVNSIKNSITIGTTNRLETIEKALKNRPGRFDRIVEIPPLTDELRDKMFRNRLSDWKVNKNVWAYLVEHTDEWTGAEVQELVNSLHLKHISSKRKVKEIDKKWAEEIIETMDKFGVGEASSRFGFSGKKL